MKKVLITGGAGFIGKNLISKLLKANYNIVILDSLDVQVHTTDPDLEYLKKHTNLTIGDIRDHSLVTQTVKEVDCVIHLAALTGTGQSMYDISSYSDVNCTGTSAVLEAIINNKENISKVVVASSRAIYGEGRYICENHGIQYPTKRDAKEMLRKRFNPLCPICCRELLPMSTLEDNPIQPTSIYGLSKYYQEKAAEIALSAHKIPFSILRFQNVYGPGQSLSNPYTGILSIFSNLILKGEEINIFEDGNESRDFIHVEDVCDAIVLALETTADSNIYNIGSGKPTSVSEVLQFLNITYNKEVKSHISGNFRIGDIRHNYADITRASTILGFMPQISIEKGIESLCKWVLSGELPEIAYQQSLNEMKSKNLQQ